AQLLGIENTVASDVSADPLEGIDPLAWLESLAARQGANPEELVTGGTLDLPEAPAESATSGEYSMFAASSENADSAMAPESALSWLEELAKEQAEPVVDVPANPEIASIDAGGASDDINEVQAWLFQQARNLEITRDALEQADLASDEV